MAGMSKDTGTRGIWQRVALACLAVLLVAAAGGALFRNQIRSLASLEKVDDYPLYVLHLYGSYGLEELLQGRLQPQAPLPESSRNDATDWACTVFAAQTLEGDRLLARNFDWRHRGSLLLFTHPPDGHASAAMVDLAYLVRHPNAPSLGDRVRLFEAPYWPFDGMNEAGLAVGMMAVPAAQDADDPARRTLGSLHAMRLILDRAATVEEAIALLEQYNVDFEGGPPLHYLVADATGASAVIEYVRGEMQVVRPAAAWQAATNFVLTGQSADRARQQCGRYAAVSDRLAETGGRLSAEQTMALLGQVSQPNTMWSVVYHLNSGDIEVSTGREYVATHTFHLPMRGQSR
jgi:hypothetical protein